MIGAKVQTAYVQFLQLAHDPVYVELVMSDSPQSKLQDTIRNGGGLHHLCYSVRGIDAACEQLRSQGMLLFCPPVPAAASMAEGSHGLLAEISC
jgi:glyoxalase/bleomycin resistance protein/dioxygenase superfamily protein